MGRGQIDWTQVAYKFGVPSVIALALVWFLMEQVSTAQAGTHQAILEVGKALDKHVTDMRQEQAETRFYLRQICINAAKDEAQRAGCVPPEFAR